MKILIVGGTGVIGKSVVKELSSRHEIIVAGRNSGDVRVDIASSASIKDMYASTGKLDAVIATTGSAHWAPLTEMTREDYQIGLNNKLMGQVDLVLSGIAYLNDNGSFTLTSGVTDDPFRCGSSAAMVNGGLEEFVRAAAIEMPKGIRINTVSPTILEESMEEYAFYFRGFKPVSAADVALAYTKSVEGLQTGRIYRVG